MPILPNRISLVSLSLSIFHSIFFYVSCTPRYAFIVAFHSCRYQTRSNESNHFLTFLNYSHHETCMPSAVFVYFWHKLQLEVGVEKIERERKNNYVNHCCYHQQTIDFTQTINALVTTRQ